MFLYCYFQYHMGVCICVCACVYMGVYVYVSVHVCVCSVTVCICVWVHICTRMRRPEVDIDRLLQSLSTLCFKTKFSPNLELTCLSRLGAQQALGIPFFLLSSPPGHQDFTWLSPCLVFYRGAGGWFLRPAQQACPPLRYPHSFHSPTCNRN